MAHAEGEVCWGDNSVVLDLAQVPGLEEAVDRRLRQLEGDPGNRELGATFTRAEVATVVIRDAFATMPPTIR